MSSKCERCGVGLVPGTKSPKQDVMAALAALGDGIFAFASFASCSRLTSAVAASKDADEDAPGKDK